jgi:L-serine/L-threonine ammonia-lyase
VRFAYFLKCSKYTFFGASKALSPIFHTKNVFVLNILIIFTRSYGAEVIVHGSVWDEADKKAHELCESVDSSFYVPPFNHPLVWAGNASLIDELAEQFNGTVPDCMIASVGGGGLIIGIIEGMIRHGWMQRNVKIIAVETEGADCFSKSIKANQVVTLDLITR